jgi:hypothetical protein
VIDEDFHEYGDGGDSEGKSDVKCRIGHRYIPNTLTPGGKR